MIVNGAIKTEYGLYSFNKIRCRIGHNNKSQHFEKCVCTTTGYENKIQHFDVMRLLRCIPQRFS